MVGDTRGKQTPFFPLHVINVLSKLSDFPGILGRVRKGSRLSNVRGFEMKSASSFYASVSPSVTSVHLPIFAVLRV